MSQEKTNRLFAALRQEGKKTALLLRCVPSPVVALFTVGVVCMNLLANKTLVQTDYLALDGGILLSWLAFLCMDMITRHFGAGAANRITFFAAGVNWLTSLIFFIAGSIPSSADDYSALDGILRGTWFILLSSTIAFLVSGVINNLLNAAIGRLFRKNPNGKLAFAARSYFSTFIGQFADNLLFALLVFRLFAPIFWDGFSWTIPQCLMCALTGAVAELLMEVLFSPIGYRVTKRWQELGVGKEYFDFIKKEKNQ